MLSDTIHRVIYSRPEEMGSDSASKALQSDEVDMSALSDGWWSKLEQWWDRVHIPLPYIPKVYTLLKWSFLIIIAVSFLLTRGRGISRFSNDGIIALPSYHCLVDFVRYRFESIARSSSRLNLNACMADIIR